MIEVETLIKSGDTAMSEAGQKFFLRMAEIVPEKRAVYEREAQRICEAADKLKNNFSKI